MLESLHVKNLALIKESEVFFGPALNILTGETGAGKSIIIGSVNLALGAKADKDIIRRDAEYALIELLFRVEDEKQAAALKEMDIETDENGVILIQRKIMENRSVSKVNGETVLAKQLKQIASILIDIHSQYEHQSLLHTAKQKKILDEYAGGELSDVTCRIERLYREYRRIEEELSRGSMDEAERKRELDLALFEANEIESAALKQGEDERLEQEYRKMTNARKISESVGAAYALCAGEGQGCLDAVNRALREMRFVASYDEVLQDMERQLQDIEGLLHDFGRQAYSYMDSLEFDSHAFAETENRLNTMNRLKDKYGSTVEQIFSYAAGLDQKIEKLQNFDTYIGELKQEKESVYGELLELCKQASQIRRKYAEVLAGQMREALVDLNFKDVQFCISVNGAEDHLSEDGYDAVEYLISTNPGEAMKPLGQVASGGELSRVMLALKTVLADKDRIETLIFDEIDAGISGKTAWKVAEKIGLLAADHQVICITHLPQIAAMADSHFMIEKQVIGSETVTGIREVTGEDSIEELARLSGGESITDINRENAREMKAAAAAIKRDSP